MEASCIKTGHSCIAEETVPHGYPKNPEDLTHSYSIYIEEKYIILKTDKYFVSKCFVCLKKNDNILIGDNRENSKY